MEKINLGLQVHAVREAFAEDPAKTLEKIAAMGYEGVELNLDTLNREPQFYVDALNRVGLKCFSCMTTWDQLTPEKLDSTVATCKALGITDMIIGCVEESKLRNDPAYPARAIAHMNYLDKRLEAEGIRTGYHSHDMDSIRIEGGKSFYEAVMENTPERFCMVVDTGNIMAGGDDPIALLNTYPGRSPILHVKGYSQIKGYTTPVWESELDMNRLLTTGLDQGGARTLVIEFGMRGGYEPFDRAEKSLIWLKETLSALGRI